jgi:MscS family membrane protein
MRLVHVGADLLGERLEKEGRRSVVAMIPLGRKSVKVVLIMMAAIGLLQNLGFNVTGIVAGLGVGGLALALAAQKTVENLFGGITLTVDQPVRVGDVCKWGDQTGTVEDIGLRSTRIRTVDRTLFSVPNALLSQIEIENYSQRDKIRLQATLGLRYETSPDQLRFVLAEIRKLLASHPMIDSDQMRVRFTGFSNSSLDIEVFAYVRTPDFPEFLRVREDVCLRIMDVVRTSGTGFAFPSRTVYLGKDEGLDATGTATVEATVRGWRESGQLPFPDLAPETAAELEGTLDYPPTGSVSAPAARRT